MLGLCCFCGLCFIFKFSVKVKLTVLLLCVYMCILPGKAIPKMIYTVSSGTLNPTHSLKGCSKFSGLSHKYMFLKLVQLFIIHKSH